MKKIKILGVLLLLPIAISFAQQLEPTEEKALLNVLVANKDEKPLEGETVSFIASKNKKIYTGHTDAQGKFSILIPIGDDYDVNYKNFTEEIKYNRISIPDEKAVYTIDYKITFEPSRTIVLKNVEYDFNKATLRPTSYKTLNDLVEVMKMKDKMEIEIAGHTDNIGSDEQNLKLSQERANAVRNYLISKGIKANRIIAKGYGAEEPVASNTNPDGSDNPTGRQQNRRTEVRIITTQ
jgi:outer membrane protein OmpA-like peptidoglycan-associated protein